MLFELACQWLLEEHLVRPGVTIVERLVARTRERAQDEAYRRLTSLLTPALRDSLDAACNLSLAPAERRCPGCSMRRPP